MKKDAHNVIRDRLHARAGLAEPPAPPLPGVSLESLWHSEWSREFERLQRNRLVMGALRYGLLGAPDKPRFDRVGSMRERLDLYEASGNTECLVDVANLCLLEFVEGDHPMKHFSAADDGIHTRKVEEGQSHPVKLTPKYLSLLVKRGIERARPHYTDETIRQAAVCEVFGVDPDIGFALCKVFGFEPSDTVPGAECPCMEEVRL